MLRSDAIIALDKFIKPLENAKEALVAAEEAVAAEQEARTRATVVQAQLAEMVAQRDSLSEAVASAKQTFERFEREFNESRKAKLVALDAEVAAKRAAALDSLREDVSKLQSERASLISETTAANQAVSAAQQELKQLQDTITRLKASVSNL